MNLQSKLDLKPFIFLFRISEAVTRMVQRFYRLDKFKPLQSNSSKHRQDCQSRPLFMGLRGEVHRSDQLNRTSLLIISKTSEVRVPIKQLFKALHRPSKAPQQLIRKGIEVTEALQT